MKPHANACSTVRSAMSRRSEIIAASMNAKAGATASRMARTYCFSLASIQHSARPTCNASPTPSPRKSQWTTYFAQFANAGENPYASQAGLARIHNAKAFLQTIYLNAQLSENVEDNALLPGVESALRALP